MNWLDGIKELELKSVRPAAGSPITVPGINQEFKYRQDSESLKIEIPSWFAPDKEHPESNSFAFKIIQN
jgi:hypothetical protein